MTITFIGSGNVAFQLAPALKKSGNRIAEICSRNKKTGSRLAKKVNAVFNNDISKASAADAVIIAVKDSAIAEVVKKMPDMNSLVIHTSGATDISVLKKKFKNCGVLWQLHTVKAGIKIILANVPFVIEASNKASEKKLFHLVRSLSKIVFSFNSHQRAALHLSAVFSNNFVNHLNALAKNLIEKYRMPWSLLHHLIKATAELALDDPQNAQTGPAFRNDTITMKKHLSLIKNDKRLSRIYRLLSESITIEKSKGKRQKSGKK